MHTLRGAWPVLAACFISFFWSQSSRAILYSVMPAISAETGLDPKLIGLLTGFLYGGYTLAMFVSGLLPWGRRATVVGGFLLTTVCNLGFALTSGLPAMLVLATLGGAGVGLYLPRGAAVLAETFLPQERARAMAWHEVAASAALMLAPLAAGALLVHVSWRTAVMLCTPIGLAAALAFWCWIPDAPPHRATAAGGAQFLEGRALALALMGGSVFMVIAGFPSMLSTIVNKGWGVSPAVAAGFVGWIRVGGIGGSLGGGWLADRYGRPATLMVTNLLTLACLLGMWLNGYGPLFSALTVVAITAASGASTAYYALLGDTFAAGERERVMGPISAAASLLGTVITPMALGYILEGFSAHATLAAVLTAPLIGLGALVWYLAATGRIRRRPRGSTAS